MNESQDTPRAPNDAESEEIAAETIDTGEPIYLLAGLEEPTSAGFLDRLGRRIERRRLGADFTGFLWHGPLLVVIEFLKTIFHSSDDSDEQPKN